MKLKNVIYQSDFNIIGGTEQFVYYLVKKYAKKYDLTVLYKTGHSNQIRRIREYCDCIQYTGQRIECEKLFTGWDISVIDRIKADEYYEMIHADYKRQGITPRTHPRIKEYIAVSQAAADSWEELTGIKCKVIYNPLALDKPNKVIHLVSATRLTAEKGKWRMDILADKMTEAGIPFQWTVFTNSKEEFKNPNVIKMPPRLDITDFIADADYLVQLSDSEAYCYSVNEALTLGTAVIVTDLPTFREEGVEEGKTGYLLPLDMNCDVEMIRNIPKFEYKPKADTWSKMFAKGKATNKEIKDEYLVEALDTYERLHIIDSELGRIPKKGEQFRVSLDRLFVLLGDNPQNRVFVKEVV